MGVGREFVHSFSIKHHMKKLIPVIALLTAIAGNAQIITTPEDKPNVSLFDSRFCFTGSRTLVFTAIEKELYVSMIDDSDTSYFGDFLRGKPVSKETGLQRVDVTESAGKIFLNAVITQDENRSRYLFFGIYDQSKDSILRFVGDVYYDTSITNYANPNCNTDVPTCVAYFYKKGDIGRIQKLKSLDLISRREVFDLFKEMASYLNKNRCNRCYEGFPGGDFNRFLILRGYNPITREPWNEAYKYQISAIDFIRDKFIGWPSEPKDKELNDYYHKKLILEFFHPNPRRGVDGD
jgi:hypothetical protein